MNCTLTVATCPPSFVAVYGAFVMLLFAEYWCAAPSLSLPGGRCKPCRVVGGSRHKLLRKKQATSYGFFDIVLYTMHVTWWNSFDSVTAVLVSGSHCLRKAKPPKDSIFKGVRHFWAIVQLLWWIAFDLAAERKMRYTRSSGLFAIIRDCVEFQPGGVSMLPSLQRL